MNNKERKIRYPNEKKLHLKTVKVKCRSCDKMFLAQSKYVLWCDTCRKRKQGLKDFSFGHGFSDF